MRRLQTDRVDLYYLHRMGSVPVEKVAEAMGRLIDEGMIRGWGLSQVDVDVISRAQRVTPLAAIQNIYSMVERDSEAEIIPYCMANNIGFVPFSPIASGLLSGKITPDTQFERNDDELGAAIVQNEYCGEPSYRGDAESFRGEEAGHSGTDLPRLDAAQISQCGADPRFEKQRTDHRKPGRGGCKSHR